MCGPGRAVPCARPAPPAPPGHRPSQQAASGPIKYASDDCLLPGERSNPFPARGAALALPRLAAHDIHHGPRLINRLRNVFSAKREAVPPRPATPPHHELRFGGAFGPGGRARLRRPCYVLGSERDTAVGRGGPSAVRYASNGKNEGLCGKKTRRFGRVSARKICVVWIHLFAPRGKGVRVRVGRLCVYRKNKTGAGVS